MREEDEVNHVVATRMKTYGEVQDTFGGQVYGTYLMNYICVCAWTRDQDASQVSVQMAVPLLRRGTGVALG